MPNSDLNPLADSLVYEDLLPLSWSSRDDESQAVNHARIAEHNEHVMRYVNMLSDQIKEKIDEESDTESALMRLDAKVNLLLEMVSNLGGNNIDLPDATQVKLASGGIEWRCQGTPPEAGDEIWINLYIDNRVPEALKILAKVLTVSADESVPRVCAGFEDMGEAVRDQLEKMIFRNHRRMVAQSRSG